MVNKLHTYSVHWCKHCVSWILNCATVIHIFFHLHGHREWHRSHFGWNICVVMHCIQQDWQRDGNNLQNEMVHFYALSKKIIDRRINLLCRFGKRMMSTLSVGASLVISPTWSWIFRSPFGVRINNWETDWRDILWKIQHYHITHFGSQFGSNIMLFIHWN